MVHHNSRLKIPARALRTNMTIAERRIWAHIRCKQLQKIQFYRQRAIQSFIVDFYAPSVKLVLEIDGSQHLAQEHVERDRYRDKLLNNLGILVLRFDNHQVLSNINGVLELIYEVISIYKMKGKHINLG
jgi:very-short-patch-repair endonuclease